MNENSKQTLDYKKNYDIEEILDEDLELFDEDPETSKNSQNNQTINFTGASYVSTESSEDMQPDNQIVGDKIKPYVSFDDWDELFANENLEEFEKHLQELLDQKFENPS